MTKTKKSILIALLSLVATLCAAAGSVFAYFSINAATSKSTITATITTDGSYIAEVTDFGDLYTATKSEYYNDKETVSDADGYSTTLNYSRKVVRLGNDITLANDLLITADVHLDLNGHTLDLNGYTLTIQHAYAGTFLIYNGTISATGAVTDDEGNTTYTDAIVIDTPNAIYLSDDDALTVPDGIITYRDGTTAPDDAFDYIAYSALYYVGEGLTSSIDRRPERLTLAEFNALTDKYAPELFVSEKTCHTDYPCVYAAVGNDLMLPTRYLSTDYEIAYSTDDGTVFSSLGNALKTGDAVLTVTISHTTADDSGDKTTTTTSEVKFNVHVVDKNDSTAAAVLLKSYLSVYYNSGNDTYEFSGGVQLPLTDEDLGITYSSYILYDESLTKVTTASKESDGVYQLEPTPACKYLDFTVNETTTRINISSAHVTDTEAVAQIILNSFYGGSIIYNANDEEKNKLYTLSDITDEKLKQYITDYNISSITYEITGDAKAYYTTTTKDDGTGTNCTYLVASGTPATKAGTVVCTFTFNEGETNESTEEINLNVLYTTGGNGMNTFLPYYNQYDAQISTTTSSSFTLPFSYEGTTPYTAYEFAIGYSTSTGTSASSESTTENSTFNYYGIAEGSNYLTYSAPDSVTLKLVKTDTDGNVTEYYSGAEFTYSSSASLVAQFDSWLSENSYDLATLAGENAAWLVEIDPTKIPYTNTEVIILYNYKFSETDDWTAYRQEYTEKSTLIYTDGDGNTVKLAGDATITTADGATTITTIYSDTLTETCVISDSGVNTNYSGASASTASRTGTAVKVSYGNGSYVDYYITYTDGSTAYVSLLYYTESTVSKFTISGGVFYDASGESTAENAIPDKNLFIWMSNTFKMTKFTSESELSGDDLFIESTALSQTAKLNVETDDTLADVQDWTGIEYLTGLTEVNLSGVTSLTYDTLSRFEAVQKLTLQNCNLTEDIFTSGTKSLYLPKLRELDVRNNSITTFDWLTVENFPKLEKAHITGNEQSDGYTGNTGISNYQAFEDLTRDGVTVYNTINAAKVEIPFAESTELNDYRKLKSLVYQAILPEGNSITTVYAEFEASLSISDFNLEGSYDGTLTWGYGGGEDDTDATYFSLTVKTSGGTALTVKFYVDRWSKTSTTSSSGDATSG